MTLADTLAAGWYGSGRVPWWCRPLAGLYGVLSALRRGLYRHGVLRSESLPVPVVVVGNLTAGGTGKTPLTIALVEALQSHGLRPGVVSRGHGGHTQEPVLLDETPDPAQVGDEPCLIRASGVPVAVGRDRPAAARLLIDAGCNVVVADDGLQHYRLARDIEICVIDGARRFGNRRLLPWGPLREPLSRLRAVDFCVCNGGDAHAGEIPMRLEGELARAVDGSGQQALTAFRDTHVHALAGIGNPGRFFDSLRTRGIRIIEHPFPDHHAFTPDDLDFGDNLPLLMTAKDAVKCRRFARPGWWNVPVSAVLPASFLDVLCQRVEGMLQQKSQRTGASRVS
ncbi:tetraacyldisaccharide 4'-kinase [Dyella sp. A6]|uniref:tetraacyldisaccharide 4'-kinase n=1 Tax=Dyella aluminiiresistens TaxID=3069105 RepID=UPI002E776C70|nr:tetraacyldisaccharide 4'-kinase [Dyella sp. A6]